MPRKKKSARKSVSEHIEDRVREMLQGGPNDAVIGGRPDRDGILAPLWTLQNAGRGCLPKPGAFRLERDHLGNKPSDSPSKCIEVITVGSLGIGVPVLHSVDRMRRDGLPKTAYPDLNRRKRKRPPKVATHGH